MFCFVKVSQSVSLKVHVVFALLVLLVWVDVCVRTSRGNTQKEENHLGSSPSETSLFFSPAISPCWNVSLPGQPGRLRSLLYSEVLNQG